MGWLSRIRGDADGDARAVEEDGAGVPPAVARASPGLSALFQGMRREGRHSILDLGEGSNRQMEVLAPYARLIRFVGLVPGGDPVMDDRPDPAALPAHDEHPYDIVLAWGVLDRLATPARAALMDRLSEITAPGARMYAWISDTSTGTVQPVRSTLLEVGKVEEEPVGLPRAAGPQLLPAHVEKLLAPWVVSHAFTLRVGKREYVARKG